VTGPAGEAGPPAPGRVIICDADVISARLLVAMLRDTRLDIRICYTAAACQVEVQREQPTALVITAILLPDMDGLELTRRLRTLSPRLGILVVSALRAASRAREAGADGFLAKPIVRSHLLAAVQELVPSGREGTL
jgi:CheY-like chemotaxis protein